MSDFDKFFAEKLDEESQFPNRGKNWRALSKRLDAFDAGITRGKASHLRYWQIAAAGALALAGWLTWKTISVQSENTELRREMAVLQEKNKIAEQEIAQTNERQNKGEIRIPAVGGGQHSWNRGAAAATDIAFDKKEKQREAARFFNSGQHSVGVTASIPGTNEPDISNPIVYEGKTKPGDAPSASDSLVALETDLTPNVFEKRLSTLPFLLGDSLKNIVVASHTRLGPAVLPLSQPDAPATAAAPKIIEPVRPTSRFRAGVQVLAGTALPSQKGVSPLTGQGLTAEFALWRGLSLTASADWLHFEVSTDQYHPQLHPNCSANKPPPSLPGPGPGPKHKLVKVEGSQRQQQYGLGLRYSLPLRFWLRPSVRIAHTWVRVSPDPLIFKYQKKSTMPPSPNDFDHSKYIVRNCGAKQLDNVWRLGAGLEHETRKWVFGLWADYSDNFAASDATFDALLLRAGVQYKFN